MIILPEAFQKYAQISNAVRQNSSASF